MKNYILAILCVLLVSCVAMSNLPSVCDTLIEPSVLCDMADRFDTRLEDIGNVLIIANAVAIGEGLYNKEDAVKVLSEILNVLNDPVSYIFFKDKVYELTGKYPGLFEIASIYLSEFTSTQKIYETDRAILKRWLGARIDSLS